MSILIDQWDQTNHEKIIILRRQFLWV